MPTRTRSRRTYRRSSPGRNIWIPADVDPTSLGGGVQSVTNMVAGISSDVLVGAVVKRIIGYWSSRANSSDQQTQVMGGIYTQRLEAFSGGIIPELEVDQFSLMWRSSMTQFQGDATSNPNQVAQQPIDVRVSRKFRSADDVALVFSMQNIGANTVISGFNVRVLVHIP